MQTPDSLVIAVGNLNINVGLVHEGELLPKATREGRLHFNLTNKIINSILKTEMVLINTDERGLN
jgi:hypothetical protein